MRRTTLTDRECVAFDLRIDHRKTFREIGDVLEVTGARARDIYLNAAAKIRFLALPHRCSVCEELHTP